MRLMHGDCLELMRDIPDGSVDMVLTDPPYGLGGALNNGGGTWGKKYKGATSWDYEAKQEWIDAILALNVPTVIWGGHCYKVPPTRCLLSFSKTNAVPTMAAVETAWTNFDMPSKEFRRGIDTVGRYHPTQKPVDLMAWCLSLVPDAKTILDPFMGSGTTGVACIQTGREFIGIEMDAGYFATAKKRIEAAAAQATLEFAP